MEAERGLGAKEGAKWFGCWVLTPRRSAHVAHTDVSSQNGERYVYYTFMNGIDLRQRNNRNRNYEFDMEIFLFCHSKQKKSNIKQLIWIGVLFLERTNIIVSAHTHTQKMYRQTIDLTTLTIRSHTLHSLANLPESNKHAKSDIHITHTQYANVNEIYLCECN